MGRREESRGKRRGSAGGRADSRFSMPIWLEPCRAPWARAELGQCRAVIPGAMAAGGGAQRFSPHSGQPEYA